MLEFQGRMPKKCLLFSRDFSFWNDDQLLCLTDEFCNTFPWPIDSFCGGFTVTGCYQLHGWISRFLRQIDKIHDFLPPLIVIIFSWPINELYFFPPLQIQEIYVFYPWLINEFCDFFPMTNWQISLFFIATDWRNSQFLTHFWLVLAGPLSQKVGHGDKEIGT